MSCSDVQTIKAGDGSKLTFSFDFPYIFKSEIHVYFWNVTTKEYDEKLTTDSTYPWRITDANPTIVEFTGTAPPAPSSPTDPNEPTVDNIKIRRITKVDDIRALFNPGSAIRSDDLNKNFEQLRYAIQESNCIGIPDDVDDYLKNYYWNNFDSTVYSTETWDSDDDQVATTQAIDARIDSKIDSALTLDIAAADGIVVTDDSPGSGQVTIGIGQGQVDFDRIKAEDVITYAEQNAGSPAAADTNIFTASAAARRFDTLVQTGTPSGSDWQTGKTWLQNDAELTLSVWNGSTWTGIASGGTFTNQPKVVYVDASSGSDSNDGHRISRPKLTIKAAVEQINNDATYGNGSVVVVAPGTYQEACPIDIQKSNVSIVGTALRSCIIHPTVATENSVMFRVNSGTFLQNLTFTGMKAGSGTGNTLDAVLPTTQGWNVAFYPGCTITKSPYIQNCTNFSDSEIDNSNINVITPGGGAAGDTDNAPTGGGLLIDGSVPAVTSPLRSIVCDSYTHVGLNGPGILVTNNGYAQCTSSYAFFNKYHIKCLNGGQANLAASTTDFGERALVADGKSPNAIFTSNVDGAANSGAISFNVNQPATGTGWFGDTNRPANNMLVTVNSVTYPILSAVANTDSEGGNGWTVTISRPDPNNRSTNLGLNGAVADNLAVEFFLRSQIASSGHTMEYVGSGMDYNALPENGGVPDETKQITELNNGKVWTAVTDHNGKFKIGGNQTDDPFFEVDQQLGFVTIPEGSIAFNLLSDETPQLGGDLDVNSNTITGLPATPTSSTEAASKAYVDAQIAGIDEVVEDTTPQLGGNLDVNGNTITSTSNANVVIDPNGTGTVDVSTSRITSVTDPTGAQDAATKNYVDTQVGGGSTPDKITEGNTEAEVVDTGSDGHFKVTTEGTERLRIDSSGNVGINETSPATTGFGAALRVKGINGVGGLFAEGSSGNAWFGFYSGNSTGDTPALLYPYNGGLRLGTTNGVGTSGFSEKARFDSSGRLLIGTTTEGQVSADNFTVADSGHCGITIRSGTTSEGAIYFSDGTSGDAEYRGQLFYDHDGDYLRIATAAVERMRIDSSGQVILNNSAATGDATVLRITGGTSGSSIIEMGDTADTDVGQIAYYQSSNAMAFRVNASEALRIDSSGRLLAGTSSSSGNFRAVFQGNSGNSAAGGDVVLARGAATPANSQALGLLGFSDSTHTASGVIQCKRDGGTWSGSSKPTLMAFQTCADGSTTPTERLRITGSGNVLFNCTGLSGDAPNETGARITENNGNEKVRGTSTGSGGTDTLFQFYHGTQTASPQGKITVTNSSTSYQTSSDYRLKENVVDLDGAITRVKQLAPKRFNFIVDADTTVDGFLAHEAQTVVPEAVDGTHNEVQAWGEGEELPDGVSVGDNKLDEDGNTIPVYQGIDQSKLVPLLTAALQEAIAKIETLETQNADLLARVVALEAAE